MLILKNRCGRLGPEEKNTLKCGGRRIYPQHKSGLDFSVDGDGDAWVEVPSVMSSSLPHRSQFSPARNASLPYRPRSRLLQKSRSYIRRLWLWSAGFHCARLPGLSPVHWMQLGVLKDRQKPLAGSGPYATVISAGATLRRPPVSTFQIPAASFGTPTLSDAPTAHHSPFSWQP